MEVIVKEEYLGEQADDDSISRLKLRLKEIEEQIVRIVEKNQCQSRDVCMTDENEVKLVVRVKRVTNNLCNRAKRDCKP